MRPPTPTAWAWWCLTLAVTTATAGAADENFAGAGFCAPGRISTPPELRAAPRSDVDADVDVTTLPLLLEADVIETEGDTVELRGDARVVQGARGLYAQRIVYQRAHRRAKADGGVALYTARGDEIKADALQVDVDTFAGEGVGVAVQFARREAPGDAATDAPAIRARASAQRVVFDGGESQRLTGASLTTCAPGNRDVELRAREITLDHAGGVGAAKAMTLRFKGAPIFYFPTATFPIDERRKTGFLFPSAGATGNSGVSVEAPYYLNLAPHYDATLTPRVFGKRGPQVAAEFRYLSAGGRGAIYAEYLPSDNAFDDQDRHALGYEHRQRFGEGWRAAVDWRAVSDRAYLRDFSADIDVIAASYIERSARLDYAGDGLRFSAHAVGYEPVQRALNRSERPYSRLPQLRLAVAPRRLDGLNAPGGLRAGIEAEYTDFQHDACGRRGSAGVIPCGARLRVTPSLSLPLRASYGYLTPWVSLRAVRYSLDERAPASDSSPAVNVPVFSVDSGLFFERAVRLRADDYLHTLEPRLRYVRIPYKRRQRAFPDFDSDTGSPISIAHLFRENRFFGGDRIGDSEHLALGISSRLLDAERGIQRMQLSLGQIFYRKDRMLTLNSATDATAASEDTTGLLTEFSAALGGGWSATAFAHWDEDAYRLTAAYAPDSGRRASVGYIHRARRRNDDGDGGVDGNDNDARGEQINAALATPLGARWRVEADAAYSLADDDIRAAALGLRFDGCCWALRIAAQRYLDGDGAHKNRLWVTLELADLGAIQSGL